MSVERNQEAKKDAGKPPMELISPIAMEQLALVLGFGAKKYSPNGWRKTPLHFTRILAAILRHTFARLRGEIYDPETGLPHTAHIMCEGMFLCELEITNPMLDDTYKSIDLTGTLPTVQVFSAPSYEGLK